jgi:hypothetical protein
MSRATLVLLDDIECIEFGEVYFLKFTLLTL